MRRIVIDANVWISAALYPESAPGTIIGLIRDRIVQSVLSTEIVEQVSRHLKPLGFSATDVTNFAASMGEISELVAPTTMLNVIAEKPSDNRVLESAVTGAVDFIVTGDRKRLLPLGQYDDIQLFRHAASSPFFRKARLRARRSSHPPCRPPRPWRGSHR
jgi:putative PIN family toxin of toxin-antitoxin system